MKASGALVRAVSSRLQDAALHMSVPQRIDVALARRQHGRYRDALAAAGVRVHELPELPGFPDCCFVEDCALVLDDLAIVTIPGRLSRQGEQASIGQALCQQGFEILRMEAPATLEGGDCLLLGRTLFVGRSSRTNAAGIELVRETLRRRGYAVRVLDVPPSLLHLKCACSGLSDDRLLIADGAFEPAAFAPFDVVPVPAEEAYAANCVVVNGTALIAAGFPRTAALLEAAGHRVEPLDLSEIRKADGSLTCLSLLW